MAPANILVLDAAPAQPLGRSLCRLLEASLEGLTAVTRSTVNHPSAREVWPALSRARAAIAIIVAGPGGAGQLLDALHRRSAQARVRDTALMAVLDQSSPQETAALLRAGLADYLLVPLDAAQVVPRVLRLLPGVPVPAPAPAAGSDVRGVERLIGRSAAFTAEVDKLPLIARCDTGVLIEGETGTGKEIFARAIHELSARADRPFVPVNCGAIPVELAESELFGHERGAFTGAFAAHHGLIAQADGGTLFLDEVASLPLLTQVKLLRFLQEKEYRPIGATTTVRANVRVVAAANTRLEGAVHRGHFRQDLFYRLNIIRVSLPPLRLRREDIPELATFFLRKYATNFGTDTAELDPAACEKLLRHDWPGNVRELEHVIERAVVFSERPVIPPSQIMLPDDAEQDSAAASFKEAKAKTVAEFERAYVEGLLAIHRGNISHAARRAGKNRRAFWELIRKNGVDAERFRPLQATDG